MPVQQMDALLSQVGAAVPPAPAAQPGAEAPIAPPQAANGNILSQLGLSAPNFADLDRAVSRSMARNADAQGQLATIAEQRGDVVNDIENIPRPEAPQLQDVPRAPPIPEPTDTLRVFGQFLPVLAMLGGAMIRNNATGALQAGAAAMQAAKDNDAEALERANHQWELNLQSVLSQNEQALQEYNAALSLRESDMDGMLARLNALAAQEQNPLLQAQIAQGDIAAIGTAMNMRLQANQQIISAMEVITRANAPLNRPLRGPDAAQMTRIRETAESARGLRGLTQDFARYLENQNTGPITGGVLNPLSYTDRELGTMRSLAARMTGLMRPTGSGATSDFEQRLYAQGAPGVDKTRQQNQEIIQNIMLASDIADARQFFYEEYASQLGTLNGAERAFQSSPEYQAFVARGVAGAEQGQGGDSMADDPLGIRGDRTVSH